MVAILEMIAEWQHTMHNKLCTLAASLPHYRLRMGRYKANMCPSCKLPFKGSFHLPEAPGSDEGKRCHSCGRIWVHESPYRVWARIVHVSRF